MGINLGYWKISVELEQMSKYLNLVQNSFDQHLSEIDAAYHKDLELEMDADEAARMEDYYLDAYLEAGRDFPRLLLLSFIMTWYSFVEQELIELCSRLKLSISVGPKDSEYFDKGIWRVRKFLLKTKGYEIDSNSWQELVKIGKLRNTIVHKGKSLSCSYAKPEGKYVSYTNDDGITIYISVEESLYLYLKKHNLIETPSPVFVDIVPTFDYCNYLVEFGKNLFKKLYEDQ